MITNAEAVRRSLIKYCAEGAFCIAFGDGKEFSKYYLAENVPFLDINDENYWLIDKTEKAERTGTTTTIGVVFPPPNPGGDTNGEPQPQIQKSDDSAKQFKSITVSGKLPIDQFTASFGYFIAPFAMIGNKVEVQISFKMISPENNLLSESSQQYKSAKEAAKQLGLDLDEDNA